MMATFDEWWQPSSLGSTNVDEFKMYIRSVDFKSTRVKIQNLDNAKGQFLFIFTEEEL